MRAKALQRKRDLKELIKKREALVQFWQQKQQEANQQLNREVTQLFADRARLEELDALLGEEDIDELEDIPKAEPKRKRKPKK